MADREKRTRQVVIWTAGVAVVALVVAGLLGWATGAYRIGGVGAAGRVTVNEHKSFPTGTLKQLKINSVSEAIQLVESADSSFGVHFTGTVSTSNTSAVPRLEAEVDGNALVVKIVHRPGVGIGFQSADLQLQVAVPKSYAGSIEVASVSGRIESAPHAYETLSARTTSGSLSLDSMTASSVSLHSVSGEVKADNLRTEVLQADTTSGRIQIATNAPTMSLHTVSGEINVASTSAPEKVEAGSTSGRVVLSLPADSQFTLAARSTSGQVRCDFPITVTPSGGSGRNELSGKVGTGGGEVGIRTTSGAITVIKSSS
ncbi:MAG TPA: DUF4097 family beta strand repeat-containing protein [Spirochaetia bacterium]|nr:DUF4097 family beta strand repeat-containing protein [Spirochaetia bacterium]